MPIRLASGLGSQAEADAFVWAAQNGADVISCSWGPADGEWWNPNDPVHNQVVPLPDSTRLAMDFAINQGRNGKGCVILFAAGNGNESVDNDGYASYQKVIAVAACNDLGKKALSATSVTLSGVPSPAIMVAPLKPLEFGLQIALGCLATIRVIATKVTQLATIQTVSAELLAPVQVQLVSQL